jgi:hypothetical protein
MLWFTKHGVRRGTPSKHVGILEGIHQLGHHCHSILKNWHILDILIEKNYSSLEIFEEQGTKKNENNGDEKGSGSWKQFNKFQTQLPFPIMWKCLLGQWVRCLFWLGF